MYYLKIYAQIYFAQLQAAPDYRIKIPAFWNLCVSSRENLYSQKFIRIKYMITTILNFEK